MILDLQVLDAQALILPPDTLQCNVPTVPLLGTGSSAGPDVRYHWTAKAGGLIAGPDDQINATAARPGSYQLKVCRTDSSGASCCDSVSVLVRKRNVAPPTPGLIVGLPVLCLGQTATYTIAPVAGASTYNWLLPPGATLISGQGDTSIIIQWDSPTAAAVCVTAADSCGNLSAPRCRVIQTGQVAPPVQIPLGETWACRDSVSTYHIPPFNGATDYSWSINAPHTLVSGQGSPEVSIRWGDAPTGKVCVQITNSCGTSQPGCADVGVLSVPLSPTLLGDTIACQTDTAVYSVMPGGGPEQYTWAVTGGQIVSGQHTPQVRVVWTDPLGFGNVCVGASNACGASPYRCMVVRSGRPPVLGPVSRQCDSTDLSHYRVRFTVTGGTAPFTVAGGSVINGLFLSDPIPNGVAYSFAITDAYGCSSAEVKGKYSCYCVSEAGTLGSQLLKICEGGQSTVVASGANADPNDLSLFILHSDSSAVLASALAQSSTGVFGLQANMSYGTRYYITHLVGDPLNGLPDPTDPCYSVSNAQPLVFLKNPIATGGDDQAVCGKQLSLAATGVGTWFINQQPPNSGSVLSDPQSPVSSLEVDSSGTYELLWTVLDVNGCVGQDEVLATFHPLPVLASITRTCDATNLNYVVVISLAGGTPPYNVGGNFIAGKVFTSPPLANGQPFSYSLGDTVGCTLPPAMGAYDCSCTSQAGTMSAQLLEACSDASVKAQPNADFQPDPDDVTGFALHDGSGNSLGAVFAYNASGVFGFLPNMEYGKTYYMSRTVGNSLNGLPNPADPCFAVAAGQPLVFYEKPRPAAGQDVAVCGQTLTLSAAPDKFGGAWSVLSGPGAASFSAGGERVCEVSATVPGLYRFGWTEVNGPCSATDTVEVLFRPLPAFEQFQETCNPTNTAYTIAFQMASGDAPFTITGLPGSFTGSSFLSQELPTESPYLFYLVDANGCQGPSTFGTHSCVCITDAGTMQGLSLTVYCAGETASATWNNNPTLDADDVVEFILHDQPSNSPGNILARNTQPVFAYQPTFLPGVNYYISAMAGSKQANGGPNLGDKCLSVTPGVPVRWKALPQVDISGTDTICLGDTVLLSLGGSGDFPLLLTYSDGINLIELPLLSAQVVTLLPSPTATTTYQLIAVQDGSLPTCSLPLMDAAVVTVNQPADAGKAHAALQLCAGDDLPFQLINLLDDADFGGSWSDVSTKPVLPGGLDPQVGTFYTAGQAAGLYRFRYTVSSAVPCPQDWEEVEVRLNPPPAAEAGENKALNCDQTSVTLEGSSTDPSVKYLWLHGADTVGFTPQVLVQDSGLYRLVVLSAVGCQASDTVRVALANQLPMATFLMQALRCYGDATGSISVDSITAGEPPVLFALNGGGFGQAREFEHLPAGPYTVSLLDA
ncbi:MAG TPA: hypothetical protein PK971_05255, partial [Saprospiraceae bacterium]|nr:hypothetical protein [Saprospiraceae bacterium]